MLDIILFSNGCPKCVVLERKLKMANMEFAKVSDLKELEDQGILTLPVLRVEDKYYTFHEAVKYINGRG